MSLMDGPRYIVLDDTAQKRGLSCTADEIGVRVIRQRGAMTKSPFSEFQARGQSRNQYEAKALQVAYIVDELTTDYRR